MEELNNNYPNMAAAQNRNPHPNNNENDPVPRAAAAEDGPSGQAAAKGKAVDDRMRISPQGLAWAQAIKAAIEADPEIDNLNDFGYVQLAVVCLDNVEEALEKARDMQGFREEYSVRDTLEDAKQTLWEFLNMFDDPFLLSFAYSEDEQSYVTTVDMAAIDHKALQSERAWRNHVVGCYYLKEAMIPDFRSMMVGVTLILECEGFDFYGKFGGLNIISRFVRELISSHPVFHRELKWFHTGTFINLMMSMVKKFLPKDITETNQFGCRFEDRLDRCLLFPDAKTAQLRNYSRILQTLERRYENEAAFRL